MNPVSSVANNTNLAPWQTQADALIDQEIAEVQAEITKLETNPGKCTPAEEKNLISDLEGSINGLDTEKTRVDQFQGNDQQKMALEDQVYAACNIADQFVAMAEYYRNNGH